MRSPLMCRDVGQHSRVTRLHPNLDQPVQEGYFRGITISRHISKLEPTTFYALATPIYERALGGHFLVGGMRGVFLLEIVRTLHIKLDPAKLERRLVVILVIYLAKFFDAMAQTVHPIVWARVGLADEGHVATHREGLFYTLPLGPWQPDFVAHLVGTPLGTILGVHAGATATLPFSQSHGYRLPRLSGGALSLPGAHVAG